VARKIVAGILRRAGTVLICQRAGSGAQPLRWEFPGGKLEAGEEERLGLERELREELGIEARVGRVFARIRHTYAETGELDLVFFEVTGFEPEPVNRVFEAMVWEQPARLGSYDFLEADRPVLELLLNS